MPLDNVEDLRRYCEQDFAFFARMMQDPDGKFFAPVHQELCEWMQAEALQTDHAAKMKIVMPRGSLKSTFATKLFPVWLALRDPNTRILITMSTHPNAKLKLNEIRGEFEGNKLLQTLWPEVIPAFRKVRWSDTQAELKRTRAFAEATFETAGTRTKLTGRHYNWIIEDDTVAPDLDDLSRETIMPKQDDIDQAIGWHRLATPLLVDASTDGRVVIGTRWSYDDMLNWITEHEPAYKEFNRKAYDDSGTQIMPKFNPQALAEIKNTLGDYMFSALYLNEPMRPEDMVFRPEWWQEYDIDDEYDDKNDIKWVITVDPAISDKDTACDTAICRAGHRRPLILCDRVVGGKFTPSKTIDIICDMIEMDYENTSHVVVESVAYQKALGMFLKDEMKRRRIHKRIDMSNTRRAKHERIIGCQPLMQNGQLIFRKDGEGIDKLKDQTLQYPYGSLIDYIDALAMQVEEYRGWRVDTPAPPKQDPNTYEAVYEELRKKGKGDPSFPRMRTGLRWDEEEHDAVGIMLRGMKTGLMER